MVEISNIDAIVELIMREARARKGHNLTTRIYNVLMEVSTAVGGVMRKFHDEERSKEKELKEAEWDKGM